MSLLGKISQRNSLKVFSQNFECVINKKSSTLVFVIVKQFKEKKMFTLFYKIVDLVAHEIELLNKAYGVKLSRITKAKTTFKDCHGEGRFTF